MKLLVKDIENLSLNKLKLQLSISAFALTLQNNQKNSKSKLYNV